MHQILETLNFLSYVSRNTDNSKDSLVLLGMYDKEMQKIKVYK